LSITISEHDYRQLGRYLEVASDSVPAKGIWLAFFNEYNTGSRQGDMIKLTASNRLFIREKVKGWIGFDPVDDPAEELAQHTRTENSGRGKNEKFLSLKPREVFLEYRILTPTSDTQGYLGGDVNQVLALNVNTIISIENFDTFAYIQHSQLSKVIGKAESIILVYRGDNIASPKAVLALRSAYKKVWFHFGDFDPQGINIGVVDMQAQGLILPTIEAICENLSLSQKDVYINQNKQLILAHIETSLSKHLKLMESEELAIMQEHICSHQLPLVNISIC
jgi:hypothetical protein